jgi:hypothetical protein
MIFLIKKKYKLIDRYMEVVEGSEDVSLLPLETESLNKRDMPSELSLEYREFCDILAEFLDLSCKCDLRNVLGKFQKIKTTDPIIHDKCVICLDKYEYGTYKRVLKCGHVFHKKCVDRWFCKLTEYDKDLTCPICRKKVV